MRETEEKKTCKRLKIVCERTDDGPKTVSFKSYHSVFPSADDDSFCLKPQRPLRSFHYMRQFVELLAQQLFQNEVRFGDDGEGGGVGVQSEIFECKRR